MWTEFWLIIDKRSSNWITLRRVYEFLYTEGRSCISNYCKRGLIGNTKDSEINGKETTYIKAELNRTDDLLYVIAFILCVYSNLIYKNMTSAS